MGINKLCYDLNYFRKNVNSYKINSHFIFFRYIFIKNHNQNYLLYFIFNFLDFKIKNIFIINKFYPFKTF